MSLDNELRKAERTGVGISKEKLIQLVRESKRKVFVVVQGRDGSYVVIPMTSARG